MKLDQLAIEEFKDYLIQSINEDVYYHLIDWIDMTMDSDQNFDQIMDFFVDNLHGSLAWIND